MELFRNQVLGDKNCVAEIFTGCKATLRYFVHLLKAESEYDGQTVGDRSVTLYWIW